MFTITVEVHGAEGPKIMIKVRELLKAKSYPPSLDLRLSFSGDVVTDVDGVATPYLRIVGNRDCEPVMMRIGVDLASLDLACQFIFSGKIMSLRASNALVAGRSQSPIVGIVRGPDSSVPMLVRACDVQQKQ